MAAKNDPIQRRRRQANDASSEADLQALEATQATQAGLISSNQAVQAEAVATRRRKAAQSLLAANGPNAEIDDLGRSTLARGRAYGARPVATLG